MFKCKRYNIKFIRTPSTFIVNPWGQLSPSDRDKNLITSKLTPGIVNIIFTLSFQRFKHEQ